MAGDVGELRARYELSTAGFKKKVTDANRHAQKESKKTGKAIADAFGKRPRAEMQKTKKAMATFVWTARGYIKDTTRVITGILIAQGFYRLIRVIQDAGKEVINFSMLLERAAVAFKYLIGGTQELADNMIRALEDLAALTPYTYETAQNAAQTLLAMGFLPEQLIPTLRLMADLSAATGGESDQMSRLAEAFGKVLALGKLTGRELKRFVTARIPIYQILREQLGLTRDDFKKLSIAAEVAIPAILRGIAKYRGAAEEMELTTSGLISSIRDYILFLSKDMLAGLFERFREVLTGVREFVKALRETFKVEGFKGVFEILFPPEIRQTIIILISSFQKLGLAIVKLIQAFGPALRTTLEYFARMLTYVLPPLTRLMELISGLAGRALKSTGFIRLLVTVLGTLWIATLVAGFVGMLTKAIVGLGIAAGVSKLLHGLAVAIRAVYVALSAHPVAAIITLVAGAIAYLAMTSAWGTRMLDRFQGAIARFFGIKTALDAVTTSARVGTNAYTDYEMSMEDLIDSFAAFGDEVEETDTKIKKFLLSFDEVYRIPDTAGGIGKLGFELPEFPEFPEEPFGDEEYIEDVVQHTSWLADLLDRIKRALADIKWPWTIPWTWPKFPIPQLEWEPVKAWALKKLAELAKIFREWNLKLFPSLEGAIDIDLSGFLEGLREALGRAIDEAPVPLEAAYTYMLKLVEGLEVAVATGDLSTVTRALAVSLTKAILVMPTMLLGAVLAILVQKIIDSAAVNWFNNLDWSAIGESIKVAIINAFYAVRDWLRTQNNAPWLTSLVKALSIILVAAIGFILGPSIASAVWAAIQSALSRFGSIPAPAGAGAGGGGTFIPFGGAQHGTVVDKEQIIRVGEGGRKEMVAPLTERALAPFARMIASEIGQVGGGGEAPSDYVLVKMDRDDYVQLERNLYKVRKGEGKRTGV